MALSCFVAGRFCSRDPIGYLGGIGIYQIYSGLDKTDPIGLSPDNSKCGCEVYDKQDVTVTGFALQPERTAMPPGAGENAEILLHELEVFQRLVNIMDLAGSGGANLQEAIATPIAEGIDIFGMPAAGNEDIVQAISNIWSKENGGILNRRSQVIWVKVKAKCCTVPLFPMFSSNYYATYEKWYRCPQLPIDMTDSKSIDRLQTLLQTCQQQGKSDFDCRKEMGNAKGV
ncbi:hypothetical protein CA13_17190 [Planctomycetes bacterium CA13]|uniref:Uncharacterized protein n=1 Tax=Novipirellula herctigrandis TaxID=2527986 RepID=A0A5C5YZW9_9BACT|nr:hypothetical protein CA13_17190 [Planctomycetes bacterium CA13]